MSQNFPSKLRGDRRQAPRSVLTEQITVTLITETARLTGSIRDVSVSGASARLDLGQAAPLAGATIGLEVARSNSLLIRRATIVWVAEVGGEQYFGLEYLDAAPNDEYLGLLNMDQVKIDPAVAFRLPANVAIRRGVLPFAVSQQGVHVACLDPRDSGTLLAIEKHFGGRVLAELAESDSLSRALERVYGDLQLLNRADGREHSRSVDRRQPLQARPRSVDITAPGEATGDAVTASEELLHAAILRQASDIHLDPEPDGVFVRFRVDGVLEAYRKIPQSLAPGLVNRFKVLAGMDIAEKREPQDGGFKHRYGRGSQSLDIRVASLPVRNGEKLTLRLLALQTDKLTLERLGMREQDRANFEVAIDQPHGLILLTGPTGSGKSTTLYAAIRRLLERENLNVMTVEDPVEYEIRGAAQAEVDSADKVNFHKALRSILRHDPDVVMVGEIRDAETAELAVKASLTGHLVFSTLHTNSALAVVTRLADLGVERFLISATLRLAVAQRLVRALCPRCKEPREMTATEAHLLKQPALVGSRIYDAVGCVYCSNRGYVGRVGLFEMLPVNEEWARLISSGAGEVALLETFGRLPSSLLADGLAKLLAGQTTIRELHTAVSTW